MASGASGSKGKRPMTEDFFSDENDVEFVQPSRKKVRTGKTTTQSSKPKHQHRESEGEEFDLDGGDDHGTSQEGVQPTQLKYYKGEMKSILEDAVFFVRLYLLNHNAYPTLEEIITWSQNAYVAACKLRLGAKYKGSL